jgi:amino acid transporter
MPIYELWRQATNSSAAATAFLVALLIILLFIINAIQQTSSHLIWAFGRDNGLFFSRYLARMHIGLGVPVWALVANAAVVFLAGCIYLASTAAFSALINTTLVLQMVSFAIPCALLMLHGRSDQSLPKDRWFRMPHWLGWIANATTVIFAMIELVFFDLPTSIPTSGSSMSESSSLFLILELSFLSFFLLKLCQITLALCLVSWLSSAVSIGLHVLASITRVRVWSLGCKIFITLIYRSDNQDYSCLFPSVTKPLKSSTCFECLVARGNKKNRPFVTRLVL